MKRCPKCNVVFEDEKRFCGTDGSTLVGEPFTLPSDYASQEFDDEQETLIRARPIDLGFSEDFSEPPPIEEDSIPLVKVEEPPQAPPPSADKPKGKFLKYVAMLIVGLVVGSGLVLGVLGLGYLYLSNQSQPETTSNEKPVNEKDTPTETIAPEIDVNAVDHSKRNPNADADKLNGSVIKKKVFVRLKPDRTSAKAGLVPRNDRLNIIKRENDSSPWYQIECEHGVRGWMHGNTIRFIN